MASNMDFNKTIYSLESIKLAADQYKNLTDISIDHNYGQYIRCRFENCYVDENLTKKEFANYVLALNIMRGL